MADPYAFTSLFADDVDYPHRAVTIPAASTPLSRGSMLGQITANGKYILAASAASDGSQTPAMVLAFDIPASAVDVVASAYDEGSFVSEKLIFGAGHTAATVEAALRAAHIDIRLKSVGVVAYPS